jgi:hypothetical protein
MCYCALYHKREQWRNQEFILGVLIFFPSLLSPPSTVPSTPLSILPLLYTSIFDPSPLRVRHAPTALDVALRRQTRR